MTSWEKFKSEIFELPNLLSLTRLFLGLFIPFLLLSPSYGHHVTAAILFIFGSLTDYWDGVAARKMGKVTNFGKIMDPLADKVLTLGLFAGFAAIGYYSFWWLVPIFAREFIITFCRFAWLYEGRAVGAEKLGKIKLCVQVAALSFSFLYLLSGTRWLEVTMLAFVAAACALTLISGYTFLLSNKVHLHSESFGKFTAALGVGLLKPAPGTWGSALALPFIWLANIHPAVYLGTFLFVLWAGWFAVSKLNLSREKDPSFVVVDEFCGMFVTFAFIPFNFTTALVGFALFRLFDIWKPPPIRQLEKLPGYAGIMMDDIGAGVLAWIILFLIF